MNFYPTIKFYCNKQSYYIRDIKFIKNFKKIKNKKKTNFLKVIKINKKGYYCSKDDDKDVIILKKIQPTKYYKIKRNINLENFTNLFKVGDKIESA